MQDIVVSVSEFVALVNQTFEFAYPSVIITGELANLRVSKGKWLYFDLKDEDATVRFFGTVYNLPGPLEDGMVVQVKGSPRLHSQYGFSVTVQTIQPVGEGAIRRAAELLLAKLEKEGLFAAERKRLLPTSPQHIGLIASRESAAYIDFMKVLNARWGGVQIDVIDVQVQGDIAPEQIVAAIGYFNQLAEPPEVLVITRGGGSAEDLQAFSTEQVTRAVAASRIPTLVAIGHERDVSLAELAADLRASTPSNAAELLVPDRAHYLQTLQTERQDLEDSVRQMIADVRGELPAARQDLTQAIARQLQDSRQRLERHQRLLDVLNPEAVLKRGYAIVRLGNKIVRSSGDVHPGDIVNIRFDGSGARAKITEVE